MRNVGPRGDVMRTIYVAVITASLTACAVPTTGVIPRGDDTYTVTRQGGSFLVTTESLKTEAIREADAYCSGKGKKYKYMYNKDIQAGALGRWPESEVLFKCE